MRVAVAGGTGVVGELVVRELSEAGHEPVVLSRSRGVDLTTGKGLAGKLTGCAAIIDVTNVKAMRRTASVAFFSDATRHLLDEGKRAGVGHLVTLSIVGAETVDLGYYMGKRAQEKLVSEGPLPWTILRATQFHEFPEPLLAVKSPLVFAPRMLSQPVAAAEVASALAGLAGSSPKGLARPMAGPERLLVTDMARRLMRARGDRRPLVPFRVPGKVGRALAGGGLLPQAAYTEGKLAFRDYLREAGR